MLSASRDYVNDAFENGWGSECYKYIEKFESGFAKYVGRKHCLITNNCTSAIHLALAAYGIGPGDEVIVPDLTWVATAEPIVWLGAQPIFCDVNYDTWCIDIDKIIACITPNTKAIIAVDLFGCMPDYDRLKKLCDDRGIVLLEDAAEALGSVYKGIKAGCFGGASMFSFHRSKTLTMGEGGCVVTDDDSLYDRMYRLRNHGRLKHGFSTYYSVEIGYKYLPSNLQAAMGCGQLDVIESLVERQKNTFSIYKNDIMEFFEGSRFIETMTPSGPGVENSYWMPGVLLKNNANSDYRLVNSISKELNNKGVSTRPCFFPLWDIQAYWPYVDRSIPNDEYLKRNSFSLATRIISLPCSYGMVSTELFDISNKLITVLEML